MNWLATIGTPPPPGEPAPSDVYSYGYSLDGRRTGKANYTTKIRYLYVYRKAYRLSRYLSSRAL
ncbi:MAG: hypothetical protein R6U61_02350 [Thermoplasmata archaeon]